MEVEMAKRLRHQSVGLHLHLRMKRGWWMMEWIGTVAGHCPMCTGKVSSLRKGAPTSWCQLVISIVSTSHIDVWVISYMNHLWLW